MLRRVALIVLAAVLLIGTPASAQSELDQARDRAEAAAAASGQSASAATGLVFRAPMSGRFYLRPAPDKPAFAEVGATLSRGQTVCLLEVMKTFNRLSITGDDLPDTLVVKRVIPDDGTDVDEGDPLLEFETP